MAGSGSVTTPIKKQKSHDDTVLDIQNVISQENLRLLLDSIASTSFGSITLQIQDGKAIQIEKNEKIRIR
jgi:hypothetical protein